jgi:hypothetical protein
MKSMTTISRIGARRILFPNLTIEMLLYGALILAAIAFAYEFSLLSRVTPYTDEWMMVLYGHKPPLGFIEWLFTPHVDHRLVLQKLIQQTIIAFNGYDFRVPTLVNTFMMLAGAFLMLRVFRLFRGRPSIFDLVVVSTICAVGTNAATWSSSFAFPATNLSAIAFAHAWMLQIRYGVTTQRRTYAFVSIFVGPFISGGGLVLATAMSLYVLLVHFLHPKACRPLGWAGLSFTMLVCGVFWATYTPSGVVGLRPSCLIDFAVGISGGSLFLTGWQYDHLKDIMMMLALAGAAFLIWREVSSRHPEEALIPIGAIFFSISCVVLSVIMGRTAYTAWYPYLKNHYGIVSAPLVPIAVLVFSQRRFAQPAAR